MVWEDEDRQHFRLSYQYVRRHLISLSNLLCSTTNNTASEDIRGSFANNTSGVIVIQDEAAMEIESNAWIPIIKGQWASQVVGWIMCGDDKQLPRLSLPISPSHLQ